MYTFWLAITISIILSVFISLKVEQLGVIEIVEVIMFFLSSCGVIIEILKWPLGKRMINNSKGFAHFMFGDPYNRSVISAETRKEKQAVWSIFIQFLLFCGFSLYLLFFD